MSKTRKQQRAAEENTNDIQQDVQWMASSSEQVGLPPNPNFFHVLSYVLWIWYNGHINGPFAQNTVC